ncbi:MAG TPA: nuclear transport factor 2 family protein [Panacibacter sp.]|nr:nuclear transport factor 2 family protein [Panacibacter sp.]
MHPNEQLINTFYTAFRNKDYKTMQDCYANNAVFNDAVFKNLNAQQVRAMWQMLITKGKDLQLEFSNVQANETSGSAEWVATYTFSQTKRKVINRIKANFVFKAGKIVQHTDEFDFYKWSTQALGIKGMLFGWTGFLRNKVQAGAMKNLSTFMDH